MTFYYAVIGNRDHIKIGGVKRPFWNFLDVQPDGFLSSLTYAPKVIPIAEDMRQRMIWDCGAWSYKNEDIPPIDAASALAKYTEFAPGSSMVIAPDHMLVDGVDHDARRAWNARQAREFLSICPDYYRPMATVHGQTIAERVEHARELADLGYQYIALGGMAARAAKKREMIETVATVRAEIPDVWLHVLGLSSPEYFRAWSDLAVESCDGSSHFKQAFTGGAFFTREGVKLKKHVAARPGEEITAPQCECRACVMLRDDGVDTRTYGSNETNMGRAAHNLNMLMAAQRSITQKTIGLVACCGEKMGRSGSAASWRRRCR